MNNKQESNQTGIPLFDGSNYNNWIFRLEILLDERNLLEHITGDLEDIIPTSKDDAEKEKARVEDKKCKMVIVRCTDDSQLETIKDKNTAKQMIDALKAIYERKSIAGQLLLRKRLLTLRFNESDEMNSHFMVFDRFIRDLKSAGAKIYEIDIVCHLLLTMPKGFDNLVTALETMDHDKLNVEFVKSRLLDEFSKRKPGSSLKNNCATAMNAKVTYNFCNKGAHYKSQCRKLKKQFKGKNTQNSKDKFGANNAETESTGETLLCAIEIDSAENSETAVDARCVCNEGSGKHKQKPTCENKTIKFILDSGATEHMVIFVARVSGKLYGIILFKSDDQYAGFVGKQTDGEL